MLVYRSIGIRIITKNKCKLCNEHPFIFMMKKLQFKDQLLAETWFLIKQLEEILS